MATALSAMLEKSSIDNAPPARFYFVDQNAKSVLLLIFIYELTCRGRELLTGNKGGRGIQNFF
ncbi:hypothetical protein BV375_07820 [Nostoc sp. 106C]|nr:hypothetical protein BV375_07820 [Nostoc sp. 106C]